MFVPCAAMYDIAITYPLVQGMPLQLERHFMHLAENSFWNVSSLQTNFINNFKIETNTKHLIRNAIMYEKPIITLVLIRFLLPVVGFIKTQPLLNVLIIELFQAWDTYHHGKTVTVLLLIVVS